MAEYISDAEVLQRALDTYGSALQIVVMMEEMSELQKELCKYLRGKYSPANIAEEIADVAPVVHCRHCRSYNKPRLGWCAVHMDCEGPDDFCGYGKRNEVT